MLVLRSSCSEEELMFVILGATGKIGGATISALREAGTPVRAVVRERSKAGPRMPNCNCGLAGQGIAGASVRWRFRRADYLSEQPTGG
jgi:uncharacterized protein YbjT (DUF2867 family)